MLTMFDTFYGPFEQFTSCFLFDIEKSYDSSDYLGDSTTTARIQLLERKGVICLCEDAC